MSHLRLSLYDVCSKRFCQVAGLPFLVPPPPLGILQLERGRSTLEQSGENKTFLCKWSMISCVNTGIGGSGQVAAENISCGVWRLSPVGGGEPRILSRESLMQFRFLPSVCLWVPDLLSVH